MRSVESLQSELKIILGGSENPDKSVTLHFHYETIPEARNQKSRIIQIQKQLRQLKKDVNLTMTEVRSQYTAAKANVQAGTLATFAGRKRAGHDRAVKKENLHRQQQTSLQPYQTTLQDIDRVLLTLDETKLKIDKWIEDRKQGIPEETTQPAAPISSPIASNSPLVSSQPSQSLVE